MRPGPATQAALLSRTFLTAVFHLAGGGSSRSGIPKNTMQQCTPETHVPSLLFSVFIPLCRGTTEEAATPGHQLTGHEPDSPGDSPSRESPATLNTVGSASENILAL